MLEDDCSTSTSTQQIALEKKVLPLYQELDNLEPDELDEDLHLLRAAHTKYLHSGIGQLPGGFAVLDASRPWICYWVLHSLALLGADLPDKIKPDDIVHFLSCCQDPRGGYGGGPMQMAHLAPTYAAVAALVTLGTPRALSSIDRWTLFDFLKRMCIPAERGGGFSIHEGGEADLRACYTAMAVAHMLCLDKEELLASSGMVQYIKGCQTYEGGLGGEPGNEAHGGYTFCGLAAMALAGQAHQLDLPRLAHWAANRQGSFEGGFNGRSNKLVDGCYSFWQGGLFSLLQQLGPEVAWQSGIPASVSHPQSSSTPGPAPGPLPDVLQLPAIVQLNQAQPQLAEAEALMGTKAAWAQGLVDVALQAGEDADAALRESSKARSLAENREARELLDQARQAQEIADAAHQAYLTERHAASLMYPVPDPADPPAPLWAPRPQDLPRPNPPLFNSRALQLWILRCCQQAKGGLRDKPGKNADFYHTCYCLSGLAGAQHSSGVVLGPPSNRLMRADPRCNVVDERLKLARATFAGVALKQPGQM